MHQHETTAAPPHAHTQLLALLRDSFIGVADATHTFQGLLHRRLREIDRKALNAQVLVKRHGKDLAGYGVVAQSFREGAQQLQAASSEVQQTIHPLMLGFMDALRNAQSLDRLLVLPERIQRLPQLQAAIGRGETTLKQNTERSRRSGSRLRKTLEHFENVVAGLEYVVVNGRIEAALKGDARAALAQVSADMDLAVRQVRDLLAKYTQDIEKALP